MPLAVSTHLFQRSAREHLSVLFNVEVITDIAPMPVVYMITFAINKTVAPIPASGATVNDDFVNVPFNLKHIEKVLLDVRLDDIDVGLNSKECCTEQEQLCTPHQDG